MARILIKNGRIWDGERFFFADLMTDGGVIAKIEPSIEDKCDFVFDASGKTVLPGLVDAHVHISGGVYGIHPAMCTFPFGVTAVADAGVHAPERLLYCGVKHRLFVNANIKDNRADFAKTQEMLSACGDRAIGLKVYFDKTVSEVRDITPICETVAFAEAHGLSIMVHSSNPPVPMKELLERLRCGDILTHAYHGGVNNVSEDDFASLKEAQARGVIIDAGMAGHVHTDFAVFRAAIAAGALPDIISTDITRNSAYKRGGRYGLTMCMSIARDLGMSEGDIFRAVTSSAAKAIGMEMECGRLEVGRCADVCVLDYADEGYELTDKAGNTVKSETGYRNVLTIVDGELVYRR